MCCTALQTGLCVSRTGSFPQSQHRRGYLGGASETLVDALMSFSATAAAAAAGPPPAPPALRVLSLLPSATDTVVALGLEKLLVGRSHEVSISGGFEERILGSTRGNANNLYPPASHPARRAAVRLGAGPACASLHLQPHWRHPCR